VQHKISKEIGKSCCDRPVVGPRRMEQLMESLRALEIKFSQEQLDRLDEI
jgi:aryl-alcohol dehydrogenase-like predicted oxidoreductase